MSQSEIGQKQKLRVVLDKINRILNLPPHWSHAKWSVDSKLLPSIMSNESLHYNVQFYLKKSLRNNFNSSNITTFFFSGANY